MTTTPTTTSKADLLARTRRALPTVPLEHIRIASPCTVSWASMTGDEQRRHCGQCDRTVHDLSKMSRAEAEALVNGGERVCVRLWVRADGTVLTQDCPVGLARVRRHLRRIAGFFGGLLASLVSFGCTPEQPLMGEVSAPPPRPAGPQQVGQQPGPSAPAGPDAGPLPGGPGGPVDDEPRVLMGEVCAPDVAPPQSDAPTTAPAAPGR